MPIQLECFTQSCARRDGEPPQVTDRSGAFETAVGRYLNLPNLAGQLYRQTIVGQVHRRLFPGRQGCLLARISANLDRE